MLLELYPTLIFSLFEEFSRKKNYDVKAFENGISFLTEALKRYFMPRNNFIEKQAVLNSYFLMISQV